MTYAHISQIEQLRQAIQAKRDRCVAINYRAIEIRHELAYMNDKELANASVELSELRRELFAHEMYIQKAQKKINEFYRNPIREDVAA